jgi:hypothetical protein
LSPSTVPAAARPPPLPVSGAARPPPLHARSLGLPPGGTLGLGQWRRQRPARPATPFSFLCFCPRGRLLARLVAGPWPALCPPPLPRLVFPAETRSPRPGFRARLSQGSGPSTTGRIARSLSRVGVGSRPARRVPAGASRAAHPPGPPGPGTYPAALRASPAARLLCGRSQSARRRCWSPSPPSGAGGAAAAAIRGTPELPRAPSARLAELLAPRRRPSGRGKRALAAPAGPRCAPKLAPGLRARPEGCSPPTPPWWAEKTRVRSSSFSPARLALAKPLER